MFRRKIFFAILVVLSLVVGAVIVAFVAFKSPTSQSSAKYLVIIVIDAARPDYLNLTSLPNIEELMNTGATYINAWVGQLKAESVTSHASLSTGNFPKHHGVLGFYWKDPKTNTIVHMGSTDVIKAGKLEKVIEDSGVPSISQMVKEQNSSAKILSISERSFAADLLGTRYADYIIFRETRVKGSIDIRNISAVPGHELPKSIMEDPYLSTMKLERDSTEYYLSRDKWVMNVTLRAFQEVRPKVILMNLPNTDAAGHVTAAGTATPEGRNVMTSVIKNVDEQIGRLIDAYKSAGIFSETLFIITADHGMVPNDRNFGNRTAIGKAVREAGAKPLKMVGSSLFHIILDDSLKAKAVAENIDKLNLGELGVYYTSIEEGNYSFLPSPKTKDHINSTLDSAHLYLLNTLARPGSIDIAILLHENTIATEEPIGTTGAHSGASWFSQHIPLIISGPGVKKNYISDFPARLVDIAPTALTLMGISPRNMDGVVLADAMIDATNEMLLAQDEIKPILTQYVQALIWQSNIDRGIFPSETSAKTTSICDPETIIPHTQMDFVVAAVIQSPTDSKLYSSLRYFVRCVLSVPLE